MDREELAWSMFHPPLEVTTERRELLLVLAQQDGQSWTEDQDASGWDDHTAEIMYGEDADALMRLVLGD